MNDFLQRTPSNNQQLVILYEEVQESSEAEKLNQLNGRRPRLKNLRVNLFTNYQKYETLKIYI